MIGLEIHCQLTRLHSKLFCPCRSDYRMMDANTNTCPVCMGLPGTLPMLNEQAVRSAISVAMSLNCQPPSVLAFHRKNYFYPDLPKNFQITQYDTHSVGGRGSVQMGDHTIGITRVQLEEDPGRIAYDGDAAMIDYNRAGVALVEIVTEPDFETPRQAREFMGMISGMVESLGVADTHLEGAMRADGNVSVHGGNKVEIKNINSFHDLEKALRFETTRQNSLHDAGRPVHQETRHWDERRRITIPSRTKETAPDYRYFLEGDIPLVALDDDAMRAITDSLPENVVSRQRRYVDTYGIAPQVAYTLAMDPACCKLFEESHTDRTAKLVANLITTDFMGVYDTRQKRANSKLTAAHLADISEAVLDGRITRSQAKAKLRDSAKTVIHVEFKARASMDADIIPHDLGDVVSLILKENPDAAQKARTNKNTINHLVGMVMKKTRGSADPQETLRLIRQALSDPDQL